MIETHLHEIAAIYDEWYETLPPQERDALRANIKSIVSIQKNVGVMGAKEIIVKAILWQHGTRNFTIRA
jgi:hypothetical protein